jgi:integrase
MRALIEACRIFRGQYYSNGVDHGRWWEAFVLVCYDTALRRGDMLALRRRQVEKAAGGFVVRIVQEKTGDGIIRQLRHFTMNAVDATFPPDRELIFDWPHSVSTLHDHWKEILQHAGMDPDNRRNGVQKIRRTSASHLERVKPGAATAHLGHRSADMAPRHYLDPKISRGDLPMPPDLGVA